MTEERRALAELPEKADEGDFLRAVAEAVSKLLMEADVEGLIGAGALRAQRRAEHVAQLLSRAHPRQPGSARCDCGSPNCGWAAISPPFLEARKGPEKALVVVIRRQRDRCCRMSIFPSRTAANCTARMRWTSEFSADVVVCCGARDLVTKSEALPGSLVRLPDHSCLAGLRRPCTPRLGLHRKATAEPAPRSTDIGSCPSADEGETYAETERRFRIEIRCHE